MILLVETIVKSLIDFSCKLDFSLYQIWEKWDDTKEKLRGPEATQTTYWHDLRKTTQENNTHIAHIVFSVSKVWFEVF